MAKKSVYVETTIVSYLAALPSRDLIKAARQQVTREWWARRKDEFDVFVSQVVLRELSRGDAQAVERRKTFVDGIPVLQVTPEAESLTVNLIRDGLLPEKAVDDALHLSVAATHGMDFLLTWNCRHLANAELIGPIECWLLERGIQSPTVCTPDELLETSDV